MIFQKFAMIIFKNVAINFGTKWEVFQSRIIKYIAVTRDLDEIISIIDDLNGLSNFPTVSQNTVEHRFTTTIKIH